MAFQKWFLFSSVNILLISATCLFAAESINIPGLFNTGVDEQGARLPDGSLEQHYSLAGMATVAYVFHEGAPDNIGAQGAWSQPASDAMWIGPSGGTMNAPQGDFIFTHLHLI